MRIVKLLFTLHKMKLLSPNGLYRLIMAFYQCGINMMTLLHFAGHVYRDRIAIVDEKETLTYKELLSQSEKLSVVLKENIQMDSGQKVGFLCHNHSSLIKAIFAVSRLGADLYFLNTEISEVQLRGFLERHQFDVLIYDVELTNLVEESGFNRVGIFSYHSQLPAINNFLNCYFSHFIF